MSRPPQAKKVAPPAVPLDCFRHSGSSFGSAGYISAEDPIVNFDSSGGTTSFSQLLPPGTPGTLSIRDDQSDYGSTISKSPGSLNNFIVTSNTFTFPVPRGETLTHKAAVYYHQQLALQEDQVYTAYNIIRSYFFLIN
jgi:CASK-interacting protein